MYKLGQVSKYLFLYLKSNLKSSSFFNSQNSKSKTRNNKSLHRKQNPIKRIRSFLIFLGKPFFYLFLFSSTFIVLIFHSFKIFFSSLNTLINLLLQSIKRSLLLVSKQPYLLVKKIHLPQVTLHPNKVILIFISLLIIIFSSATFFYIWILQDLPSPERLITRDQYLTTQIFDRNGTLLYQIYQDQNRTLVNLDQIPKSLQLATIAIEDQNFYQHSGLSISGIVRALRHNLTSTQLEGGSTITQQLVKNALLTSQKSLRRKLKEVVLAFQVELIFTKDQILQMYLNEVGYGGTAYGVQAAAQQYFDQNVTDLDLAQTSFLAGLTKAPTQFSPYSHPNQAKNRQLQVLNRMIAEGFITTDQAQSAYEEKLYIKPPQTNILAPHFVMYLKDQLVQQYGETLVNHGGLQVHTTLDLNLQDLAQSALNQELDKLGNLNVNNGAVLITNPSTGEILAMVGSRNYFDFANDGQVNLTTSLRQPGSSVKPITYALAFSQGLTPSSLILDAPITFHLSSNQSWSPVNYDNKFHGLIPARTALASSYNIPAAKLITSYGVTSMINLAQSLGITTWNDPSRFVPSVTLGSLEVKMIDMAQVYSTFANLGYKIPLTPIHQVFDSQGNPLAYSPCTISPTPNNLPSAIINADYSSCTSQQVISPEIAYLINDILSDPQARAPAFGINSVLNFNNQQVAVKTGTSNELRDNWTIGYTQNFLVASWVGNNDNSPMSRVASGITGASPIWKNIMSQLLKDLPPQSFDLPQNIIKVPICTITNTLTCPSCPNTKLETFVKGTEPTTACTPQQTNTTLTDSKDKKIKTKDNSSRILTGLQVTRQN